MEQAPFVLPERLNGGNGLGADTVRAMEGRS